MKQIFILQFILLMFGINAQIKISGNINYPPMTYKADTLEKALHNVYYNIDFIQDAKNNTRKKSTIGLLQIGKNYSKFFDSNQKIVDSLNYEFSKLEAISIKEVKELMANPVKWKAISLKNNNEQKVVVQNRAGQHFQYEETLPSIDWQLENEQKEILGHRCRKATAKFRGRNYTAWYAESIPINNGPYLFENLPGLIMEIYDSEKHYHFTAIAIDNKPTDIYLTKDKKRIHTTREKYRVAEKSFHENPEFHIITKAYNKDGSPMKLKAIPHNPIELE